MTLPPADQINWGDVSLWAGGVATVVVSMGIAIWKAIKNAARIAATLPPPLTRTDVYTTDTAAMGKLTAALDAANVIMTENNILRREEHQDRAANRACLEANTEQMRTLNATLSELRVEVRELTREIVRGR